MFAQDGGGHREYEGAEHTVLRDPRVCRSTLGAAGEEVRHLAVVLFCKIRMLSIAMGFTKGDSDLKKTGSV